MPAVIKVLLPLLIELAQRAADALVAGEELPEHGIKAIKSAYYELSNWGAHFAADTETDYDDLAVKEVIEFLKDTAAEAGIELPVV